MEKVRGSSPLLPTIFRTSPLGLSGFSFSKKIQTSPFGSSFSVALIGRTNYVTLGISPRCSVALLLASPFLPTTKKRAKMPVFSLKITLFFNFFRKFIPAFPNAKNVAQPVFLSACASDRRAPYRFLSFSRTRCAVYKKQAAALVYSSTRHSAKTLFTLYLLAICFRKRYISNIRGII